MGPGVAFPALTDEHRTTTSTVRLVGMDGREPSEPAVRDRRAEEKKNEKEEVVT